MENFEFAQIDTELTDGVPTHSPGGRSQRGEIIANNTARHRFGPAGVSRNIIRKFCVNLGEFEIFDF